MLVVDVRGPHAMLEDLVRAARDDDTDGWPLFQDVAELENFDMWRPLTGNLQPSSPLAPSQNMDVPLQRVRDPIEA